MFRPTKSGLLEQDILGAMPEDMFAERPQLIATLRDRQEMVAGELPDLAGKLDIAIGEEELGFADAARDRGSSRPARDSSYGFRSGSPRSRSAERDPTGFAAPAHMDDALPVRHQGLKFRAGPRRQLELEPRREAIRSCDYADGAHSVLLLLPGGLRCR